MQSAGSYNSICITGLGLVSSLGYDVFNACAAARAGISRAAELDYFKIKSREDGEIVYILGHEVPNITRGFEGFARQLVLSKQGISDLLNNCALDEQDYRRAGLYLSLPDPRRLHKGLDLIRDEEIRQSRLEQIKESQEEFKMPSEKVSLCEALTGAAGLAILQANQSRFYEGHCGAAAALSTAVYDLLSRKIDYAIVGGVDTLLEEETLQWLLDTGRLKTDSIPAGLQPGEAGAFILAERYDTATARGAEILGLVAGIEKAEEEKTLFSGKPAPGRGMSEAITQAVLKYGKAACLPFWIVTDQNGEPYRAMEWGYMLTRLLPGIPELGESTLWYPAAAFGDTAAASGYISICMIICGFQRGYNVSDTAVVISSSDDRERSAILIAKGPMS